MGKGKKKDDKKKSPASQEPSTESTSQVELETSNPQAPQPATSEAVVEETVEEEFEGLGLGARPKKNKPKKKKGGKGPTPEAPSAEPVQPGPKPGPGPQSPPQGPTIAQKTEVKEDGAAPVPATSGPAPSPWQRPSTAAPQVAKESLPQSRSTPAFARDAPPHGRGRGRGQPPAERMQEVGSPTQQHSAAPTQALQTIPATKSREFAPGRAETVCRYKIPDKVLGRSVRAMRIRLLVNYLPMKFQPIKVYRYDVSFKPDRPKKLLKTAYNAVIAKHFKGEFIAFDQSKNCFSLRKLALVPNDARRDFSVEVPDTNNRLITFEVSFKQTGIVDLGKIKAHMESQGSSLQTPYEEIQCIDVILRQGALDSYVKSGRQFFKRPLNPINLSGGLEMWTGLFQSAIFTSNAFINVDVAHKGFPIASPLTELMTQYFNMSLDKCVENHHPRDVENFKNFLKRLRVEARLIIPGQTEQTREFIVNGLIGPPKEIFFTDSKTNKKISVYDYFLHDKKYTIRHPNLNCAWVGPKEKNIYYPLEILSVSYGQVLNKQLNETQLSTMVRQAATPPDVRKKKIEEVARSMNYSQNAFFRKFGLEISNNFLEIDAKVLEPPSLTVGDNRTVVPRRGVWQITKLQKPEALEEWGFMGVECQNIHPSNYTDFKLTLMDCGKQMGMRVNEPRVVEYNRRLTEVRNVLAKAQSSGIKLMILVISSYSKEAYHKVKKLAECEVGIVTQCLKDNTLLRKMNPQTMKNILLKINSKMMGVNQTIDSRSMPRCMSSGGLMVVGADVTHPSPDQSNIPSIAAVTASLDLACFTYNVELSIQTPKKEVIVDFENMMFDHLKVYLERNRTLPRKIYVFRDGVSEGQFAEVLNCELTAIHRAYERLTKANRPEVLFLLVQKRHHTRFFLGSNNSSNVEPGTCVDTHIVHPKELDFYLVSHTAIKGTARPTRYHAVCNDGAVPHDEVEQLTYYLCHLYSRCTRSVSYPTPTYYAHLACFRARSLTYGVTFDNREFEKAPQRLRVLDKMLKQSRMFFV